jgi:hypothetical protein
VCEAVQRAGQDQTRTRVGDPARVRPDLVRRGRVGVGGVGRRPGVGDGDGPKAMFAGAVDASTTEAPATPAARSSPSPNCSPANSPTRSVRPHPYHQPHEGTPAQAFTPTLGRDPGPRDSRQICALLSCQASASTSGSLDDRVTGPPRPLATHPAANARTDPAARLRSSAAGQGWSPTRAIARAWGTPSISRLVSVAARAPRAPFDRSLSATANTAP